MKSMHNNKQLSIEYFCLSDDDDNAFNGNAKFTIVEQIENISNLADLNNALVWMVSILPQISNYSRNFSRFWGAL